MAVTLINGQTVTAASFLSGGHKTYFVPSLESTYSWASQASASATAAAQSAQAAAASAAAAANAGNNDVTAHAADLTRHLTPTQNTLLDGITATFTEVNALTGANSINFTPGKAVIRDSVGRITTNELYCVSTDIGSNGIATRMAVETAGERLIKWQTPASFFKSLGRIIMDNLSQGRFLRETNGGVMQIGATYGIWTVNGPITMSLPPASAAYNGATIEFFDIQRGFSPTNHFTLNCDSNSAIGALTAGAPLVNTTPGTLVKLVCCKDSGGAFWAKG